MIRNKADWDALGLPAASWQAAKKFVEPSAECARHSELPVLEVTANNIVVATGNEPDKSCWAHGMITIFQNREGKWYGIHAGDCGLCSDVEKSDPQLDMPESAWGYWCLVEKPGGSYDTITYREYLARQGR